MICLLDFGIFWPSGNNFFSAGPKTSADLVLVSENNSAGPKTSADLVLVSENNPAGPKTSSDLVQVKRTDGRTHARTHARTEEKLPGTAPTAGPQAATRLASMEFLYREVAKWPPHSNNHRPRPTVRG